MTLTDDLLWSEAGTDHVAREGRERLSRAKVAAAGVWPFLALAKTAAEFDQRMALVGDHLAGAVPADLYGPVTASLREDYLSVQAAGSPDDWRAQQRKPRPEPWEEDDDDHAKGDEAADRAWERRHESRRRTADRWDDRDDPYTWGDGYDPADEDPSSAPEPHRHGYPLTPGPHGGNDNAVSHAEKATDLYPPKSQQQVNQEHLDSWMSRKPSGQPGSINGVPHGQNVRSLDFERSQRRATMHEAAWWDDEGQHDAPGSIPGGQVGDGSMWDHEGDNEPAFREAQHPAGFRARVTGGGVDITHSASPEHVLDHVKTEGGPPGNEGHLRDLLHGWVDAGHGRWAEQNIPSVGKHLRTLKESSARKMTFWHEGARKWVIAAVADGPVGQGANPYYFEQSMPEQGVNTWNTGQYPQHPTGGDPVDPINQQFPMEPGPWGDKGGWSTNDMHLMPGARNYAQNGAAPANPARNASRHQAADGWQDEGVQTGRGPNPHFFDGGQEGVGNQSDGQFPTVPPITGNPTVQSGPPERTSEPLPPETVNQYDHMNSWPTSNNGGMGQTTGSFAQMAAGIGSRHPFARNAVIGDEDDDLYTFGTDPSDHIEHRQHHEPAIQQLKRQYGPMTTPFRPSDPSHRLSKGHHHKVTDDNPRVNDWGQGEGGHEENNHIAPVHPKKKKDKKPLEDSGEEMHKHRASFAEAARVLANGDMLDALSGAGGINPAQGMDMDSPSASGTTPPAAGSAESNVPQSPTDMSGMGGAAKAGSRHLAEGGPSPSSQTDTGGGGGAPAPPSITGGPGSVAQPPMPPTGGGVPQTTPPATTPGGGGGGLGDMGGGMDMGGANVPTPTAAPTAPTPVTGSFARMAAELNRAVETPEDPTGLGDEFKDSTIPKLMQQRPIQTREHRNVNTPQKPEGPIPTVSSPGAGDQGQQEEQR